MSRRNEIIQVGVTAPAFDLPDPFGGRHTLDGLLARGPLVLSFHRGTW